MRSVMSIHFVSWKDVVRSDYVPHIGVPYTSTVYPYRIRKLELNNRRDEQRVSSDTIADWQNGAFVWISPRGSGKTGPRAGTKGSAITINHLFTRWTHIKWDRITSSFWWLLSRDVLSRPPYQAEAFRKIKDRAHLITYFPSFIYCFKQLCHFYHVFPATPCTNAPQRQLS